MAKEPANNVTLRGRAVFGTEKAVLWRDEVTGYEHWFPLSIVSLGEDTLTVSRSFNAYPVDTQGHYR